MKTMQIDEIDAVSGGTEWSMLNDAARAAGSALAGAVDEVQNFFIEIDKAVQSGGNYRPYS